MSRGSSKGGGKGDHRTVPQVKATQGVPKSKQPAGQKMKSCGH
jgi:hypothetical protein